MKCAVLLLATLFLCSCGIEDRPEHMVSSENPYLRQIAICDNTVRTVAFRATTLDPNPYNDNAVAQVWLKKHPEVSVVKIDLPGDSSVAVEYICST